MKLWIDDIRPAPDGYMTAQTVHYAISLILLAEELKAPIELIDIDHDAGDFNKPRNGGDYINVLKWLEETGRNYPIHIHSMNPVGVQNMRAIIKHNGWTEIF